MRTYANRGKGGSYQRAFTYNFLKDLSKTLKSERSTEMSRNWLKVEKLGAVRKDYQ